MDSNLVIVERHLPAECYASQRNGHEPKPLKVEGIVQHFFSGRYAFPDEKFDLGRCWELMRDMNFEPKDRIFNVYNGKRLFASAHYFVSREGDIWELVPLEWQAWHAGKSQWHGKQRCNEFMVGIENIGQYGTNYTDAQYESNARLCRHLMDGYGFGLNMVTGHENVCLPEGRKNDPGPTWDWLKLHELINSL